MQQKIEPWEVDFKWLEIRHMIKDAMKQEKLPDMNTILLLIGMQELGFVRTDLEKEEKENLMHVAVCSLLSELGYYDLLGKDEEGWPIYRNIRPIDVGELGEQATLLKQQIIYYFNKD